MFAGQTIGLGTVRERSWLSNVGLGTVRELPKKHKTQLRVRVSKKGGVEMPVISRVAGSLTERAKCPRVLIALDIKIPVDFWLTKG